MWGKWGKFICGDFEFYLGFFFAKIPITKKILKIPARPNLHKKLGKYHTILYIL